MVVNEHIMRILCNLLLLILMINQVKATNQIEDVLYHGQDTLFFYDSPLEKIDSITTKIFDLKKDIDYSSDCWRGFQAEWKLINDTLYLLNVYECNTDTKLNSVIEQITGRKFKNGLIKADWVTGYFWSGKDFVPEQTLYISIFKHECNFEFANGYLKSSKQIDYIPCDYLDKEKLTEFVIQHMDSTKLPDADDWSIRLSAYLQSDKTGKIVRVKIESSTDSRFNDVVKNALIELPCRPVYFNRGEFWQVGETVYLTINEKDLKKYLR